jgi:hypothetical protein
MAASGVAPIACNSLGRWAAIAVEMNQVAPNTKARTIIVHGMPAGAAWGGATSTVCGAAFGTSSRFIGNPITRCSTAQATQAPRQPKCSMNSALVGQPTVLANPANSVMPVIALRASRPYRPAAVANAAS